MSAPQLLARFTFELRLPRALVLVTLAVCALACVSPPRVHALSFKSAPGSPFQVHSNPLAIASGDFNGDPRQDLAIANARSYDATVLLGKGDADFVGALESPFAVGGSPFWIATGDFNGDRDLDLATANASSDSVSVLLRDGPGDFEPARQFGVGDYPTSIASADFNGDGDQDLATANSGAGFQTDPENNVSVLLGDGAGGFEPARQFDVGDDPLSIAIGDFNRDGKQDLATSNFRDHDVTVLLGDGRGGFKPAPDSPFQAGERPSTVVRGDFNGDQKQDLLTTNPESGKVTLLLGEGNGGFERARAFDAGDDSRRVAVADFDGDSKQDLAVSNADPGQVRILLGDGKGGFGPGQPFGIDHPLSLAAGDFNIDGKPDLAVVKNLDDEVTVLLNTTDFTPPGGPPAAPPPIPDPEGAKPQPPFDCQSNPTTIEMGPLRALVRCPSRVKYRGVPAILVGLAGDTVRINGIDFTPPRNERIAFQPKTGGFATLDEGSTRQTESTTTVRIPPASGQPEAGIEGSVAPFRGSVGVGGARAAQNGSLPFPIYPQNVRAPHPDFPLPLHALRDLKANPDGSTSFTADLGLPRPLDQVSARVTLTTTNSGGLRLDELHVRGKDIPVFNVVEIRDLQAFWSRATRIFDGSVMADLPAAQQPGSAVPKVEGRVVFVRGDLQSLSAKLRNLGVQVSPGIFLQDLGGAFQRRPFRLEAEAALTAGPRIVGEHSAAEVSGKLTLAILDRGAWTLGADPVTLNVVGLRLGQAHAHLRSSGSFDFGGSLGYSAGPFSLNARVGGGYGRGAFFVEGAGTACAPILGCAGARGILSSIGLAACGEIDLLFTTASAGFGFYWGGGPTAFLGCDLGPFRPQIASAQASSTERKARVPSGLKAVAFQVRGRTAPPRLTLIGPDGTRIASAQGPFASLMRSRYRVVEDPTAETTSILVGAPAAGQWTIRAISGSSEISDVSTAESLPPVKVKARVVGRGRGRSLRYDVDQIPGQRVLFVEEGEDVVDRLGAVGTRTQTGRAARKTVAGDRPARARASTGSIAFSPATGRRGRRRIVALVTQNGLPRKVVKVASYVAPQPASPGRPRQLRARRRGTNLYAAWRPGVAPEAIRYDVRVRFANGRAQRLLTTKRRLRIGGASPPERGTVTVRGIGRDRMLGNAAKASFGPSKVSAKGLELPGSGPRDETIDGPPPGSDGDQTKGGQTPGGGRAGGGGTARGGGSKPLGETPERAAAADSGDGNLPFTGLRLATMGALGAAMCAAGLAIRRRQRQRRP